MIYYDGFAKQHDLSHEVSVCLYLKLVNLENLGILISHFLAFWMYTYVHTGFDLPVNSYSMCMNTLLKMYAL